MADGDDTPVYLGPYLLGPNDTEENGIYCGDCRELAQAIPDESVDLVLTDPPFFMPVSHYQSRVNWQRKWSDVSVLTHWWDMMAEIFARVTSQRGYVITFCNADSYAAFYPAMYNRWSRLVCLVWDKVRPGLGWNWRHQHELILVACNSGAYKPNDGESRGDVLKHAITPPRNRNHPVQKPATLLSEIIVAACPPNGIVLDPFCGSGTTAEAAIVSKRRYLCFEADREYTTLARERVRNTQPSLFTPEPEQLEFEVNDDD